MRRAADSRHTPIPMSFTLTDLVPRHLVRHAPGNSALIVVTIALGLGVTTALFTFADAALLRPLPFEAPERLVIVHQATRGESRGLSYPNFLDVRRAVPALADSGVMATNTLTWTAPDAVPRQVRMGVVSAAVFRLLRVTPAAGRI